MTREAITFRRSWLELFDVVTALDIAEILANAAGRKAIDYLSLYPIRWTSYRPHDDLAREQAQRAIGMRPLARRTGKSTSILFGAWRAVCASASCSMMASPIRRRPKTAASSLSNEASSRGSSLLARTGRSLRRSDTSEVRGKPEVPGARSI